MGTKEVDKRQEASPDPADDDPKAEEVIDEYNFNSKDIPIKVTIYQKKGEFVPSYKVAISSISRSTEIILERIRKELISQVSLGMVEITDTKKAGIIEERFKSTIRVLINKYFPDTNETTRGFLTTYLIQKSLGMG